MTEKTTSLKPLTEMYSEVKNISSKIRKMFKKIVPSVHTKFPITDEFNLIFYHDNSFDMYTAGNNLFVTYIEKEELENLQAFFEKAHLPYCIEHEVQRLLDTHYLIQNSFHVPKDLLKKRALEMELLCYISMKRSKETSNNKAYN